MSTEEIIPLSILAIGGFILLLILNILQRRARKKQTLSERAARDDEIARLIDEW